MKELNGYKKSLQKVTLQSDAELNRSLQDAVMKVIERQQSTVNKLQQIDIRALKTATMVDALSEEISSMKHAKPVKQIIVSKEMVQFTDNNDREPSVEHINDILLKMISNSRIRRQATQSADLTIPCAISSETKNAILQPSSSNIGLKNKFDDGKTVLQTNTTIDDDKVALSSSLLHESSTARNCPEGKTENLKNSINSSDKNHVDPNLLHQELSKRMAGLQSIEEANNTFRRSPDPSEGPLNMFDQTLEIKTSFDETPKKENIGATCCDASSPINRSHNTKESKADCKMVSPHPGRYETTPPRMIQDSKVTSIFESDSSDNDAWAIHNKDIHSKVEEENSPVVFRDVKQLSPRAISRDISPIIDVDVEEEFNCIIEEEKELKENVVAEPGARKTCSEAKTDTIPKKSIFESDSDEDLFKPVSLKESSIQSQSKKSRISAGAQNATSIFDDSSDSEDSLFRTTAKTLKTQSIQNNGSKPREMAESLMNKNSPNSLQMGPDSLSANSITEKNRSLFSEDSEDDLFRGAFTKGLDQLAEEEKDMTNRAPGKLNVSDFGGKLNNILMNGPPKVSKFPPAQGSSVSNIAKKCPSSDDEARPSIDQKIATNSTGVTKKIPGKLDVGKIGGKLNNILLNGPADGYKKESSKSSKNNEVESSSTLNIDMMKARPRGPANRRPPSRSMVISSSTLPDSKPQTVKKTISIEADPLSK